MITLLQNKREAEGKEDSYVRGEREDKGNCAFSFCVWTVKGITDKS